jgi:YD repeat-containing protein
MLDPSGVGYTRTYDAVGRLLTETTTGQQTVRFAYEFLGLRVGDLSELPVNSDVCGAAPC